MTADLQDTVLRILKDHLRAGSSEAEDARKRHLPTQAVRIATPDSLSAFLTVHRVLADILGPGHCRTRHAGRTSKERIGLSYVTRPIVDDSPARVQIQTFQLPLNRQWAGYIHATLSGHERVPVKATFVDNIGTRAGRPVFLVTAKPTPEICEGLIDAFRASSLFGDIQH